VVLRVLVWVASGVVVSVRLRVVCVVLLGVVCMVFLGVVCMVFLRMALRVLASAGQCMKGFVGHLDWSDHSVDSSSGDTDRARLEAASISHGVDLRGYDLASCENSIGNSDNHIERVEGQWSSVNSADGEEDDRVTHCDDGN
jgi:hypothetical protein